jgi:choline dehydrogenase
MIQVGKPRGHGSIRYPNADPHAKPVIESRLFENADDRAHGLDQLEIAATVAEQKPLRDLASAILPPRAVLRRRDWMERWIRSACDSGYHASGTVPMGRDGDASAATDGRGRVRGVEGLVVGDASLFPTIPTANTHLATLMVGERMAEFLASE